MIQRQSIFLFIILFFACTFQLQCTKKAQQTVSNQITIHALKKGCLIVRLQTHKAKIEKLQKMGFMKEANQRKKDAETQHKELMAAFKQEFKFCPVYFIKSEDSHFLLNRDNWKGLFLNDKLKRDASIKPTCKDFLTAELGETDGETNIAALVVMSDEFVQLQRPFPAYVRQHILGFSKSYPKMVKQLNQRFYSFYGVE